MEEEARVSDQSPESKTSYWLDACEDVTDEILNDFVNFDSVGPELLDDSSNQVVDPCFFGGIDSILENIKNGGSLIVNQDVITNNLELNVEQEVKIQGNGDTSKSEFEDETNKIGGVDVETPIKENVVRKYENRSGERRDRGDIGLEGRSKRARVRDYDEGRGYSGSRHGYSRDQFSRKRSCDYEEGDWRYRDRSSKRGRYNDRRDSRDSDFREKERRGYWERDKSGKLTHRVGSWEAEREREAKRAKEENFEKVETPEKKPGVKEEKPVEELARKYQLDVLEQAKKKNTIAFLETGAGKTLIAVLLIKSVYRDMLSENRKLLAIFLVPKVPLVYQQAEVIREGTGYKVGHYCGEMGQDFWDARRWQREFESKQVLVMTAQILLNILRHSIIRMEAINLLILDECHHAVKKHPYSLVMSEFYHTTPKEKRPAIFGMTASPVNMKGVSSQEDCAIKIRNLESKLDSIVCTIKDRQELEKHVPTPSEVVVEYDKAASLWSLHEQLKQMEQEVEEAAHPSSRRSKWQFMGARDAGCKEELRLVYGVSERTESDGAANLIQKLRAINYALSELGQWCAYKVAHSFLTALQNDERANYQLDIKFQESYLNKVVSLLQCQLLEGAVSNKDVSHMEVESGIDQSDGVDELEEGELSDSHG